MTPSDDVVCVISQKATSLVIITLKTPTFETSWTRYDPVLNIDIRVCDLSLDNIHFAKNLEFEPHHLLFYHFKHTRRVPSKAMQVDDCLRFFPSDAGWRCGP